jgi:exodeoxyribonuclease V alpha subunit
MPESLAFALDRIPGRELLPQALGRILRDLNLGEAQAAFALELARMPRDLDPGGRRDVALLALALLAAQAQGHTRMPLEPGPGHPARALWEACGRGDLSPRALVEDPRLAILVGAPGAARPILRAGDHLHTHRAFTVERSLAAKVLALAGAGPLERAPVPEGVFTEPVPLNPEQRAAVELALERPLALITGGPGTGKTAILSALLRALLHQPGVAPGDVALAAPTGKAAQRMGQALGRALGEGEGSPGPQTLHRLLAWHPARESFRHDEENPLPARVVVVDEASMVGQELMEALLRALAPGARLILLGDADQLPSVEGGSVFKDLVETLGDHARRLETSYRMRAEDPEGRAILSLARALQAGDPLAGLPVREGAEQWLGSGAEWLEGDPQPFLARWFRERILGLAEFPALANRVYAHRDGAWAPGDGEALAALFRHWDRLRILCPLKEAPGLRGAEGVNALLHRWMHPVSGAGLRSETPFYAGEPLLMTANDYRRGVFNGDQGICLKVDLGGELRQAAVFPGAGGFRAFPLEGLRTRLELAYALTVHKAQGSEYDHVAILLPRPDHPALTRELLYTALTRARRSATLVGEREALGWAQGHPTRRETALGGLLGPP